MEVQIRKREWTILTAKGAGHPTICPDMSRD